MNSMTQPIPFVSDLAVSNLANSALAIDMADTQAALESAAVELQARYAAAYGERYRVEDLQTALHRWLELSIESLVEDVLFHTLEGDRSYAFNRHAFEIQLRQLQPEPIVPALHQAA